MSKLFLVLSQAILLSLFLACSNKSSEQENVPDPNKSPLSIQLGFNDLVLETSLTSFLDTAARTDPILKTECVNWQVSPTDLTGILSTMKQVEVDEIMRFCYHIPCHFEAKVKNETHSYLMTVSAGGYIVLVRQNETLCFIRKEESDLFLMSCDCCE